MEASQTTQQQKQDEGPRPDESQREYEQRTGQAEAPGTGQVPAEQTAGAAPEQPQAAQPPAGQDAPLGSLAQGTPADNSPKPREITHTEPILATGASGEAVVKLVRLLAGAGYATNTLVNATNPHSVLDDSVMADVRRLWDEHTEAREDDQLYSGREGAVHELQGSWVGPNTWQTLYDLQKAA